MGGKFIKVQVQTSDGGHVDAQAWRFDPVGEHDFEIVGESHFQAQLWSLVGSTAAADERMPHEAVAVLLPVSDNPYDANAVEVHIDGMKVGHLSRDDAADLRADIEELSETNGTAISMIVCNAAIFGGYVTKDGGRAMLGVKLDLELPLV